jgi:uncharacterized protein (TIGR02300 family)
LAKADLGEKQICPNCGAKFYDLGKRPAVCPKCATAFDPGDEIVKLRRVKATKAPVYEGDFEDEEEGRRPKPDVEDGFEEEAEETRELDAEAADDPPVMTDEDEEEAPSGDALPDGFSEGEADLEEEVAGDDEAPMLDIEDDEEFGDDDLEEIEGGDDDDDR